MGTSIERTESAEVDNEILRDYALVNTLRTRFLSTLNHDAWSTWREEATKCYDYRDGDQWTKAEEKILIDRGQPIIVNNQIKMFIDYTLGQYLGYRSTSIYRGKNTPNDDMSHHTMTALKLFIEQNSMYEFKEKAMMEDGAVTGFGCLDIRPVFNPKSNEVEVKITDVDCFEMYPDPFSRKYDWNDDARFLSRERWVEVAEAVQKWPAKKNELLQLISGDISGELLSPIFADRDVWSRDKTTFVDEKRRRVRLIEQWWKTKKLGKFIQAPNGEIADVSNMTKVDIIGYIKADRQLKYYEELKETLHSAIFTSTVLLEHVKDPHRGITMYPYVPYFVVRKKNGKPYSAVITALSMQDAINKRESKATHFLNVNQTLTQKHNIQGSLDEYAKEVAKPDGIIEVKDINQIRIEKNVELASVQLQFHAMGLQSIRQIFGINPEALGDKSEIRSGVGVQRKQAGTAAILGPMFDSLRMTKVIEGRLILEYIKAYYTGPLVFKITDDPKMGDFAAKTFQINQQGEDGAYMDVNKYAYDIVIGEIPKTDSMHQAHFQELAQMLPKLSQVHPMWASLLVQASDLKDKDKLMAILEQINQQTATQAPKASLKIDWEDLSEAEKVTMRKVLGFPQEQEQGQLENAPQEEMGMVQ